MFLYGYPTLLNFWGKKKVRVGKIFLFEKYLCRGRVRVRIAGFLAWESEFSYRKRSLAATIAVRDDNTIAMTVLDVKRSPHSRLLRRNIFGSGFQNQNGIFYRSERDILAGRSTSLPAKDT